MYRTHFAYLALLDAKALPGRELAKDLALQDVHILAEADRQYGSSWLRRGGVGAYMVAIRKIDRLETQLARFENNFRRAVREDRRAEGVMNDLRDFRRYLYLWEAQALELGIILPDSDTMDHPPELSTPDLPSDALEALAKAHGYDIFETMRQNPAAHALIRFWRQLLLRWELALMIEGLVPPLTPLELEHRRGYDPGIVNPEPHTTESLRP